MDNLLKTGGVGGIGAAFGVIASWFGFKYRLDAQDKRLDTLSKNVVYEDTCEARSNGIKEQLETYGILLAEMRKDIKSLLRRNS